MTQDAATPAQVLRIDIRKEPEQIVFVCEGRITSETSPKLKSTVQPLIAQTKRIVIDLTGVNYVDSSGIGGLVSLWVSTRRANCDLKLVNLNDRIKDLLKITNLSNVLQGDQEYFGM